MEIVNFKNSNFKIEDLINFLEEVNYDFIPSLQSRFVSKSDVSSFNNYALKLMSNGIIEICTIENNIAGLIAYYANDYISKSAYIPILAIKTKYRQLGIGNLLLLKCIENVNELVFTEIKLETWENNSSALKLYTNNGFKIIDQEGINIKLIKKL